MTSSSLFLLRLRLNRSFHIFYVLSTGGMGVCVAALFDSSGFLSLSPDSAETHSIGQCQSLLMDTRIGSDAGWSILWRVATLSEISETE